MTIFQQGNCFEAAAYVFLHTKDFPSKEVKDKKLCHGVGISNHPDMMGKRMAHAWVEYTDENGQRWAADATNFKIVKAEQFRLDLKMERVIEYTQTDFIILRKKHRYVGPYDKEMIELAKQVKI